MSSKTEAKLCRSEIGRWMIGDSEIHSGEVIEVLLGDHWISTRIEYGDGDYYAVNPGIRLYLGMKARVPIV